MFNRIHRGLGCSVVRLLVVILAFGVAGCHRWVPLEEPLAEHPPGPLQDRVVRVTMTGGEQATVTFPVVTAESTLTSRPPVGQPGFAVAREEGEMMSDPEPRDYPAYPISSIASAEARRGNAVGTVALVVLGLAVVMGAAIAAAFSTWDTSY